MANFKFYILILVATTLAYFGSVKYGFSQDDFYFLFISKADSLGEVMQFFSPWNQQGFAFFRPLGTQLYYYLFEQNPYLMHIFMLIIQSLNGYLVYRFISALKIKSPTPILVAIAYSVSSVHFLSLYYIAATQQLLAATFSLLSLILFLKQKYWCSAAIIILALLSKETAIVAPVIAFGLLILTKAKFSLRQFVPYSIVFILYLVMRLAANSGTQSEYHLFIGPSVLTNIRWYFLFAANFPEVLVSYGLPRMGIDILKFIADYGTSALIITLSSGLVAVIGLTRLFVSKRWLYAIWFVAGLGPIILLRDHLYPHYLDLALIPFLLLLFQDVRVKLQYFISALYILTSIYSIQFSEAHHWTTGRAIMTSDALTRYDWGRICASHSVAFVGEGSKPLELSYALSLANGPRVLCDKPSLGVYYLTAGALAKEVQGDTMPEDVFIVDIGDRTNK